jgi:hypothetical protein
VDGHIRRRVAGDRAGERGERRPGVGDDYGGGHVRDLALGHDECRAAPYSLPGELDAVALEAGDGDEGEAGLYETRVVDHAPDTLHSRRRLRPQGTAQPCVIQENHVP